MRYRLSMPEPHSHLFEVEAAIERPRDQEEVVFPVWTPGSYLVREFARNVEALSAQDGEGGPLPLERLDKHRLRLAAGGAAQALIRCRVYANELTVRTAHLDGTHGYLNGAAVFPFVRGREGEPHALDVVPPPGWRVSTALEGGPTSFRARDYDELADSPVEIGTHRTVGFTALGKPHEIAIWGRGNLDEARLVSDARRIVEASGALMGGLPYDRYVFIVHLIDKRKGGLEHARSTTLEVQRHAFFPREAYEETLGLLAHEFFHLWNVKRLRPAAFVPFDYGREQYTRLLWWFEGATSYYEQVALARAGILQPKRWLKHVGQLMTSLERTPGASKMSLEEASFLAWVKHYRQDENTPNSAISYYLKGELVALALDLELRKAGRSLDDLLRALYAKYVPSPPAQASHQLPSPPAQASHQLPSPPAQASHQLPSPPAPASHQLPSPPAPAGGEGKGEGGLPEDAIEQLASDLLGREPAKRFFDLYIRGTTPLDLDTALEPIGVRVHRRAAQALDDKGGTPPGPDDGGPPAGFLGVDLAPGDKLTVKSVREGSPAHRAGLYAEDEIVAVDGFRVDRGALWDRLCEKGPGGTLQLTVFRRDELVTVPVVLAAAPDDTVWLETAPDAPAAQRAAFEAWSGGRWPAAR